MRQATHRISVRTSGRGLYDFTREVVRWVDGLGFTTGLVTLWVRHTSASLTVQENASPEVLTDLNDFFTRLAPDDMRLYRHTIEGADDMPSHIRAALTLTQLSIPIVEGRLALGTWQGIYLFEHRMASHHRSIVLHAVGE